MNDVSLRTVVARGSARAAKDIWRGDPFVARLRSFVDLSLPELQALRAVIEAEQSVKKRRDLVHDGYEFNKLCFVKDGFAARYKLMRNGKRQIVNFILPGDVVGLPGSFLDRAANSVIAVSDMKLQVCSLEAFVGLCCRRPKFGLALTWLAVQEGANCAERIIDIGRRTPIERLAHLLLEIHSRLAMVGCAEEAALNLPFTQEMMSDALGLSVPHLNRMLTRLRSEGMIALNDRRVEFLDLKAMALLAQFQPVRPARIPLPTTQNWSDRVVIWRLSAAAQRTAFGAILARPIRSGHPARPRSRDGRRGRPHRLQAQRGYACAQ
jgi:CRP-like cAMP-binding protein